VPRKKQPKEHEIVHLACDPSVPFELRKAEYTRLSDDDLDKISHGSQQHDIRMTFGLTQALPPPLHEEVVSTEGLGQPGADRGYVIVAIYRDWDTGVNPKRIAMRQMAKDAHAREHSGVVFRDDDRLFRDVVGGMPMAELHRELPEYTFEVARGTFSIEDFAIHAWMTGKDREKIRQRTMAARRMRAAQGRAPHGKLPWWLFRDEQNGSVQLRPNHAAIIADAIRRFARGDRMGAVVDHVNSMTPAEDVWSGGRLREVFRNPGLYGRLDYGRSDVVTEKRGDEIFVVGRRVNPKAVPFRVPPLIHEKEQDRNDCRLNGGCHMDDLVAFDTLDGLIKQRNLRDSGKTPTRPHPLRRRVVCPCGWRMAYMPKVYKGVEKAYGYLRCIREHGKGQAVVKDYPPCAVGWVTTTVLWPKVQAKFIDAVQHPDCVVHEVEQQILLEVDELVRKVGSIEEMTDKLAELKGRENRLYERYDLGRVSQEVYDEQRMIIDAQRREIAETRRLLLDRQVMLDQFANGTRNLRAALVEAQKLEFPEMTQEEWATLFDDLVQDVVLDLQGEPSLRWKSAGA